MGWVWLVALAVVVVAVLRLVAILPRRQKDGQATWKKKNDGDGEHANQTKPSRWPIRTLIVLGSGGHTAEILRLVSSLHSDCYVPRWYVWAATDTHSQTKMQQFESTFGKPGQTRTAVIPRSREVGQSYFTSLFTTLFALLHAVGIVIRAWPELILCNGPGTCIPICLTAYMLKFFGKNIKIVYVESMARVETLSLSGKLLYCGADHFLVQWPQLKKKYPAAQYLGRLC